MLTSLRLSVIVAMSRARLALYVFAKISLFANCFELKPAFSILTQRPSKLQVYPKETNPTTRQLTEPYDGQKVIVQDMPHMATFVYELYMEKIKEIEAQNPVLPPPEMKPLREALAPTPIVFEETDVIEKPSDIELALRQEEIVVSDKESDGEEVTEVESKAMVVEAETTEPESFAEIQPEVETTSDARVENQNQNVEMEVERESEVVSQEKMSVDE